MERGVWVGLKWRDEGRSGEGWGREQAEGE